jgi:hypothetical protein
MKKIAAELMVAILNMLIRTQKCPTYWKEGDVVMLPKPFSEEKKYSRKLETDHSD